MTADAPDAPVADPVRELPFGARDAATENEVRARRTAERRPKRFPCGGRFASEREAAGRARAAREHPRVAEASAAREHGIVGGSVEEEHVVVFVRDAGRRLGTSLEKGD